MSRKTVYNKNLVTPEKWESVNEENKELMENFLDSKEGDGLKESTLKQYRNDLRIFFCWVLDKKRNIDFFKLTRLDFGQFQKYQLDMGVGTKIVSRRRSSVNSLESFVEVMMGDVMPDFRPRMNKTKVPVREAVREKSIFSFEDCKKIADTLLEEDKIQLASLIIVACYSGLRKAELTRLLHKDFTTNVNLVWGDSFYKTSKILVKGSGDRKDHKYVWKKCDEYLQKLLEYKEEKSIISEYLFCDINGEQLGIPTMDSYANTINRICEKLELPKFYWHSLRHTLPTMLTKMGLPMEACQKLLGHGSTDVTKLYIDIDQEESMEQFADLFSGKITEVEKKGLGDL
ncbi:MAG: tyrosine-type recombinase/integrase [Clostridium sp.]|uniref:tyrosine-type recombinase/integrase n=1 Tax=Clostridium sp. TaxID=1506 RepID=UPI003EE61FA2